MKASIIIVLSLALAIVLLLAPPDVAGALFAVAAIPALATVGFGHSAKAYVDDKGKATTTPPAPVLANHHFSVDSDGSLRHEIDGRLRANVPPDGLKEYAELWPDCKPIVDAMLRPGSKSAAPPATDKVDEAFPSKARTVEGAAGSPEKRRKAATKK